MCLCQEALQSIQESLPCKIVATDQVASKAKDSFRRYSNAAQAFETVEAHSQGRCQIDNTDGRGHGTFGNVAHTSSSERATSPARTEELDEILEGLVSEKAVDSHLQGGGARLKVEEGQPSPDAQIGVRDSDLPGTPQG